MSYVPGPWEYEMRSLYETNIVVENKIIARIHAEDVTTELATARLIVAAPELIDLLRAILTDPDASILDSDRDAGWSLISKIEGRQR